ncbi:MAG TPA: ATP-binding protein [Fimbriiglobus sp.]|jgi:signal transduction histidine kinase
MSYRGFKRLLGESGLERKTRMLLGAGVVLLVSGSFYIYARQTEDLAYDQLRHTGQALVPQILAEIHAKAEFKKGLTEFREALERDLPETWKGYKYRLLSLDPQKPEEQDQEEDYGVLDQFRADPKLTEVEKLLGTDKVYLYYAPVRAGNTCVGCHADKEKAGGAYYPNVKPGEIMVVARIRLSTVSLESGFHKNRALLLAVAAGTTILIMAGSYLIIRYVIVKPVKHLKDVADAIAAGELNVRSEIQTGDEFEDLSRAFNRMLRNLLAMQDRNRELITDLDRKVDEQARLNMALYESNRLKGDFLSTMSHELRTPLNSIIGFSEVLLSADNLSEKQHRYAANIMTAGQQLLALINDILDLAKSEAGKMRAYPSPLVPAEVIEPAVALFRPQADKKNIDLRLAVPPDLPEIFQDAGKLRQILANLVSNAVKFTPEGGRVSVAAAVEADRFILTVQDTGVGIAPEEQELIFDKFRQSEHPLTREQGGTGLGLSIIRELAKLLGGDVSLKSELGRGSTFTVKLASHLKADPNREFDLPDDNQ